MFNVTTVFLANYHYDTSSFILLVASLLSFSDIRHVPHIAF